MRTIAMLAALLAPAAAWAQDTIEFKGAGWVNAKDISLDRLKGKVVFVYFVEET